MDKLVIKYYRQLLRGSFEHAGSLENPSIYLDSIGERIRICGTSARNFMHIYINIRDGVIEDIKYLCTCDPTANVVVEILCTLVKGGTIEAAEALNEASFTRVLGGGGEEFLKKAQGIIELLKRGIARYKTKAN